MGYITEKVIRKKLFTMLLSLQAFFIKAGLVYPVTPDSTEQPSGTSRVLVYVMEGVGSLAGRGAIYGLSLLGFHYIKQHGYDVDEYKWILISYGASVLLGPPIGVGLTGKIMHQKGSYLGALIGSVIGTGAATYVTYLHYRRTGGFGGTIPTVLNWSCPYLGPVIGYNYKTFKDDLFAIGSELYSILPDIVCSKEGLFACIVLLGLVGMYLM